MASNSSKNTAWAITLFAAFAAYLMSRRSQQSNPPSLINNDISNMNNYFLDKEFTQSETAKKYGISNEPDLVAWANLHALRDNILNPVRYELGKPIYITSGYRSGYLNSLVGGAGNSQHTTGEAVDITTRNKDLNRVLFRLIVELGNFDQLIWEKGGEWIHVSYSPRNRRQILSYNGSSYTNINNNWQNVI